MKHEARDYTTMDMKTLIETIIRDSKVQGTVTIPFRTEGYHTCSNVILTDRL